ncbi:hypothetical protein DFH09DRAFT_46632 [Mycena vulgaris]|nr:hypothetical protein DFH09DRAFT_46632 [Mycena vulgaris]
MHCSSNTFPQFLSNPPFPCLSFNVCPVQTFSTPETGCYPNTDSLTSLCLPARERLHDFWSHPNHLLALLFHLTYWIGFSFSPIQARVPPAYRKTLQRKSHFSVTCKPETAPPQMIVSQEVVAPVFWNIMPSSAIGPVILDGCFPLAPLLLRVSFAFDPPPIYPPSPSAHLFFSAENELVHALRQK